MKNIMGSPVRNKDFGFRDKEVGEIKELLSAGNSVLLVGLRRIGKTSVMMGVCDTAPSKWSIKYQNLEACKHPNDLLSVILDSLPDLIQKKILTHMENSKTVPNRIMKMFKENFKRIGPVELNTEIMDYGEPLEKAIEEVLMKEKDKIFIFVLDEFSVFVERMLNKKENKRTMEILLGILRRWHNGIPNFKLFIGGSISLDRVLSKHNIEGNIIADLVRVSLLPLKKPDAKEFLKLLAKSKEIKWYEDSLIEETLELLKDYYPYFLQVFFFKIFTKYKEPNNSIEKIFYNDFMSNIGKSFYSEYNNRLEKNYSDEERQVAKKILNFISNAPKQKVNYSQIRDIIEQQKGGKPVEIDLLLWDLSTRDEFLKCEYSTNEYSFNINLIAQWWKQFRSKGE